MLLPVPVGLPLTILLRLKRIAPLNEQRFQYFDLLRRTLVSWLQQCRITHERSLRPVRRALCLPLLLSRLSYDPSPLD